MISTQHGPLLYYDDPISYAHDNARNLRETPTTCKYVCSHLDKETQQVYYQLPANLLQSLEVSVNALIVNLATDL